MLHTKFRGNRPTGALSDLAEFRTPPSSHACHHYLLSLFHISLAGAVHLSATTNFLVSYDSLTVL